MLILFLLGWFASLDGPAVLRVKHERFAADQLGNVYLISGAEVQKFGKAGQRLARYSDLRLGDVNTIDVTNPLKIVLYYGDYQQVVFLDNQLSPNGKSVALQELGLEQAALVCASTNNSFWVYDRRNNELHRFDEQARRVSSTGNLRQVLSANLAPTEMCEHNNQLYLNAPSEGIYVFDIYGTFSRLIPLRNLRGLHAGTEVLYFVREKSFCSYYMKDFDERCEPLAQGAKQVSLVNGRYYQSFGDSLLAGDR